MDLAHFNSGLQDYQAIRRYLDARTPGTFNFQRGVGALGIQLSKVYCFKNLEILPDEALDSIALAIFVDYEITFEQVQALDVRIFPGIADVLRTLETITGRSAGTLADTSSSFSNEDLPSDYLGFVAGMQGYLDREGALTWVVKELGGGYAATHKPSEYAGTSQEMLACSFFGKCDPRSPRNNEFALKVRRPFDTYATLAWPQSLSGGDLIPPGYFWAVKQLTILLDNDPLYTHIP